MRQQPANFVSMSTACLLLMVGIAGPSAAQAQSVTVNRWAILIAVDDYIELTDLKYCGADMLAFKQQLMASGFEERRIFMLHDKASNNAYRPFKSNIEKQLGLVLKMTKKDDIVVVAFGGHGIERGTTPYYCPIDARLANPESLVSLDWVRARVKDAPAALRLMIVDACRDDPFIPGTRTAAERNKSNVDFWKGVQKRPPEGLFVLTSCTAQEQAHEDPQLGHGVFMHFLLQGLQGKADGNGDGRVSLNELARFTGESTEFHVKNRFETLQRPTMIGDFTTQVLSYDFGTASLQKLTNSIGMTLVSIPAGEFLMGAPESDSEAYASEKPQHKVRLTRGFLMGQTEVTQEQYQRVMHVNPSWFSQSGSGKDDVSGLDTSKFPVDNVSWYDAVEFCNRLSALENLPPYYRIANVEREDGHITQADVTVVGGNGYRLPTEAEWEYACRAGTPTRFHFGDSSNGRESNVDGNYPSGTETKGPYLERTTTVGSYPENAWGLFDMHGNVYEWCQDGHDADAYKLRTGVTVDPFVAYTEHVYRVLRGGSWIDNARYTRPSYRSGFTPGYRYDDTGFRVSRTP